MASLQPPGLWANLLESGWRAAGFPPQPGGEPAAPAVDPVAQGYAYLVDAVQRTVLFRDVLRRRGNLYLEHSGSGHPPLLQFRHEMLVDGRTLERPCNYMLLRILPDPGVKTDPTRRPFVIVDPRAGHGPGIGGFKSDSQVGVAMRAGHPVYFIGFFPDPVPGQTLYDVGQAEARFIEEVTRRHPEAAKPCVIGNCQAGWAVAALAAVRPELVGAIVLNGAPLSYWAGSDRQNPMRFAGATLGGSWLASLAADLGNGIFDGAYLVANFEFLNPAHSYWGKPYHLYSHIDTEASRYLEFERWWGGYFKMTTEEIETIVNELFIGNQLARLQRTDERERMVNLANIEAPVVVFASFGDNITPPQQALNWIIDVYGHEDAIVEDGRVIVYLLHEDIGHLGIFVSGKVAKKEHRELVNVMDMIERLPPGLYEMVIADKAAHLAHGELEEGEYTVRFELRTMDDIRAIDTEVGPRDESIFNTVAQVSELNRAAYELFWRPWVQAFSNRHTAEWLEHMVPLRLERTFWSDRNPWLAPVRAWAEWVRRTRAPVSKDNYFLGLEEQASDRISYLLNVFRELRDDMNTQLAKAMFGPLGLGAWFPPGPSAEEEARAVARQRLTARQAELQGRFETGGKLEGLLRALLVMVRAQGGLERRTFLIGERRGRPIENWIRALRPGITLAEYRKIMGEQAMLLKMDEARALQALPELLPSQRDREEVVKMIATCMMCERDLLDPNSRLAQRCKEVLGVDFTEASNVRAAPE